MMKATPSQDEVILLKYKHLLSTLDHLVIEGDGQQ